MLTYATLLAATSSAGPGPDCARQARDDAEQVPRRQGLVGVARSMTSFRIEQLGSPPRRSRRWFDGSTVHRTGRSSTRWTTATGLRRRVAQRGRAHASAPRHRGQEAPAVCPGRDRRHLQQVRRPGPRVVPDPALRGRRRYQVLNRNEGITDSDYYGREATATFRAIFEDLLDHGLFARPDREIENSDLFKLSPFKALTHDQALAVDDILEGLFDDLERWLVESHRDPGCSRAR